MLLLNGSIVVVVVSFIIVFLKLLKLIIFEFKNQELTLVKKRNKLKRITKVTVENHSHVLPLLAKVRFRCSSIKSFLL